MIPPLLRKKGQSLISDQQMHDMTSKDPDSPLKSSRAEQAARRAAERDATMPNIPRLDRLPQEIHDKIAANLPPRSKITLADTNRTLRAAYQRHVEWGALLHQVKPPADGTAQPIFNRETDDWDRTLTDADIEQRLRAFLDVPLHLGGGPAPSTIRNMPSEDKATALLNVLRNAFGTDPGLRQVALALTRPHVEDLPEGPRGRVISAVAARAWINAIHAPTTRWCLDILERKGVKGNGWSIARLASNVRNHFDNDQECMQSFARFDALARQLDHEGDSEGHRVRDALASIYQTMPNPLDAARLLLANVAGRPDSERLDIYCLLARNRAMTVGTPAREALSDEQRRELVDMLEEESASLPPEMIEILSNVDNSA
jgi:hypothetical protein